MRGTDSETMNGDTVKSSRWRLFRLGLALGLALAPLAGCALTAPIPGGPLRGGTYTQLQPSCAIAYGPARANAGGTPVQGNGQTYGGPSPWGAPIPIDLGLRQALGSAVELGADIGWLDSGVELRVATPTEPGRVALALNAGLRSGRLAITPAEKIDEARLRLEVYPDISSAQNGRTRLLLSAGVAWGSFAHALMFPDSFRNKDADVPDFNFTRATVVRPEVRLEASVGLSWQGRHGSQSIALAPWFLLRSGDPSEAACDDCARMADVTDFVQTWGVSLIFSPSAAGDLIGRLTGSS